MTDDDIIVKMQKLLSAKKLMKKLAWQRAMNLLAFAVVVVICSLIVFIFWPQINAAWSQFLAWRNQINIR